MNYFMSFIGTLTLVILPHTHSCQNHSCQTHSCHSIHSHLILIFTHLKLTITYSHCFFNLFYYLTPYTYTFVTLRIQEMQKRHTYINIIFVYIIYLFIIIFEKILLV